MRDIPREDRLEPYPTWADLGVVIVDANLSLVIVVSDLSPFFDS